MGELVKKYGHIPGSPWCEKDSWPECDGDHEVMSDEEWKKEWNSHVEKMNARGWDLKKI